MSKQISPSEPISTLLWSASKRVTLNAGDGFPTQPTWESNQINVANERVVSVWPNPSLISRPVNSLNLLNTSGGNGSPAVVAYWIWEKSNCDKSSLIKNL